MWGTIGLRDQYRTLKNWLGTGESSKPLWHQGYQAFTGSALVNPPDQALSDLYALLERYQKEHDIHIHKTSSLSRYKNFRHAAVNDDFRAFEIEFGKLLKGPAGDRKKFFNWMKGLDPFKKKLNAAHERKFYDWLSSSDRPKVDLARKYSMDLRVKMSIWSRQISKSKARSETPEQDSRPAKGPARVPAQDPLSRQDRRPTKGPSYLPGQDPLSRER